MKKIKVLLIDDEQEFVTALVERLTLRGMYAEGALTGDQGLLKASMKDFDVVLMDVKMPGKSGLALMESIKEVRPGVKIILITGYGSTQLGEEGLEERAYHFFAKPIDIKVLIKKIEEAVQN